MTFLRSLYNSYNYALDNDLVDRHDKDETVILPLYHNNKRSNGNDIVRLIIDNDSNLIDAYYLPKDEQIIFPVTENSASRSGKNPPPHPLVDKMAYISSLDEKKHSMYMEELNQWIEWEKDETVLKFLNIIKKTVTERDILKETVKLLYQGSDYQIEGFEVETKTINNKGKEKIKKVKMDDVFITFRVSDFEGHKDCSVTTYTKLHKAYIEYENSKDHPKEMCNISGKTERITRKHRGILGNAKVVSVSNNKETYLGRFAKEEDIIRIGYETSEKIHLMLKYFLDNENSSKWLAQGQYLINWFSDDIKNERDLDLTSVNFFEVDESKERPHIATRDNFDVGDSFTKGRIMFDKDSDFYIGIIDKASNGRISVKYFKDMKTSKLIENLTKWQNTYYWYWYDNEHKEMQRSTISIYQIILAAYGVERNKKLTVDNDSFTKGLYQDILISIVEGKGMPKSIIKKVSLNIKKRGSYKKTWNNLCQSAMAILNNGKKGEYNYMLDLENVDRSYLYGRLLAIYDYMERSVYDGEERLTNADKFWTAYMNKPATTMETLIRAVKPYENKLKINPEKAGLYYKAEKYRREIIEKLDENHSGSKEENKPLEYNFIYGYYGQRKAIFTKKTEEEKEDVR